MEEEMVNVGIWEDGMHFSLSITKALDRKMAEIRNQNPEQWKGRSFALMEEADRQLKAEQSQPENPSQSQ